MAPTSSYTNATYIGTTDQKGNTMARLEPIDLLFQIVSSNIRLLTAGSYVAENEMFGPLAARVFLSRTMAEDLAKQAYWYKQFYMCASAVATAVKEGYPSGQIKRLRMKLNEAERDIMSFYQDASTQDIRKEN